MKLETGQVKKSRSGKTSYVIMALSKSKVDPGGVQFFWRVGKVSRRGLVRNGSLARRINKTVLKG